MVIKNSRGSDLVWHSYDYQGNKWFSSHISLYDFSAVDSNDEAVSKQLQKLLKNCVRLNSEFLSKWNGFKVETYLDFPRDWGLGSSSTLFCTIAEWANINALELYFKVENGSGYDVACGLAADAITYISSDEEVGYTPVDFTPPYTDNLYFIHLGKKQDSRAGIKDYIAKVKKKKELAEQITVITDAILEAKKLTEFEQLMTKHEGIISAAMGLKTVKEEHFSDYWGVCKSLGAWGGDFILATSDKSADQTKKYFADKGYTTCLLYKEMILS